MSKLRRISGAETVRALQRLGFEVIRQRGSHIILKKDTFEEVTGCVVPAHRELAIGTLKAILRQAKVDPEEFLEKL